MSFRSGPHEQGYAAPVWVWDAENSTLVNAAEDDYEHADCEEHESCRDTSIDPAERAELHNEPQDVEGKAVEFFLDAAATQLRIAARRAYGHERNMENIQFALAHVVVGWLTLKFEAHLLEREKARDLRRWQRSDLELRRLEAGVEVRPRRLRAVREGS